MYDYDDYQASSRRGLQEWWLHLTAPPGTREYSEARTHRKREQLRRAGLTSFVAPFVFISPLFFLQQAGLDPGTTIGMIVIMCMAVVALICNRLGRQSFSALLLVLGMDVVIEATLISAKGGLGTGWLLTFDLFIIPLITAGVLLSRRYLWTFMLLHMALILGDFYFLPHAPDLDALVQAWHGPAIAFARPLLLQLGCCLLSFVEIRSTDQAISRADRAEEFAELQQVVAEEKQQLEHGIKELQQTIVQAANGHFSIRVTLPRGNVLWQVASSLNTLFSRLQSSRQAEQNVRQIEHEVKRLTEALYQTRHGHKAIWPLPSGSVLDPLIAELRTVKQEQPSMSKFPPS
ncbi:MAG TPA: hypothetical protein VKR06_03160 [Ktedonosporobacter sp.]|nr:hypothetical protein [Ktedonosporobacter sp.]